MSTAEADDASPDFSVDTLFGSSIQISPDSRQFSQMEEAGKPIWDVCDFSLPCTDHLMLRPDVPYSHAISQLASSGTPFSLSDFADICEPNDPDYVGTQSLFQRLLAPFRFSKSDIILTSGCTAAINVALAEFISDDHNEVILISPYDPESPQWVRLFHGRMVVVKSQYPDGGGNSWQLDVDAIIQKCSAQTSAILVVSPNAPTGVIYKPAILREFVAKLSVLPHKPILIVDCVFIQTEGVWQRDGLKEWVTPILGDYEKSVFCYSFAKDLGIGGSRVGALCVSPGMREAIPAFQKRNADLGFLHPSRIELRILRNLSELKWSRNEALGPGHIFWVERMAVLKDMRETIRKMLTDLELPYVLPEKGPPYVLAKIPDGISFDDLREILAKQSPSVFVGFGSCHGADGFIRFCLIRPSCDAVRACESFAKAGAQIREKLALAK